MKKNLKSLFYGFFTIGNGFYSIVNSFSNKDINLKSNKLSNNKIYKKYNYHEKNFNEDKKRLEEDMVNIGKYFPNQNQK